MVRAAVQAQIRSVYHLCESSAQNHKVSGPPLVKHLRSHLYHQHDKNNQSSAGFLPVCWCATLTRYNHDIYYGKCHVTLVSLTFLGGFSSR